ncbi:hypothetical protein BDY24DRAFT_114692 [Mrakia frigida]|uniref:uncharacterized protein n=1 Tax=Mrakia frigida TaxID=29902 RepID=UPI003FCC0D9E
MPRRQISKEQRAKPPPLTAFAFSFVLLLQTTTLLPFLLHQIIRLSTERGLSNSGTPSYRFRSHLAPQSRLPSSQSQLACAFLLQNKSNLPWKLSFPLNELFCLSCCLVRRSYLRSITLPLCFSVLHGSSPRTDRQTKGEVSLLLRRLELFLSLRGTMATLPTRTLHDQLSHPHFGSIPSLPPTTPNSPSKKPPLSLKLSPLLPPPPPTTPAAHDQRNFPLPWDSSPLLPKEKVSKVVSFLPLHHLSPRRFLIAFLRMTRTQDARKAFFRRGGMEEVMSALERSQKTTRGKVAWTAALLSRTKVGVGKEVKRMEPFHRMSSSKVNVADVESFDFVEVGQEFEGRAPFCWEMLVSGSRRDGLPGSVSLAFSLSAWPYPLVANLLSSHLPTDFSPRQHPSFSFRLLPSLHSRRD